MHDALATFLAVLAALFQKKPKVLVKAMVADEYSFGLDQKGYITKKYILTITAINIGDTPVTISNMGLKYSKEIAFINPDPQYGMLPKTLMPSEEISVWTKAQPLREKGIENFDISYASDNIGRMYFHKASLIRKITRWAGWKLELKGYKVEKNNKK